MPLITFTDKGLYCEQAGVFIDPWKPVAKAIITHAHADHCRFGMGSYLAHRKSIPVMQHRLGEINVQSVEYGETISINGVKVSFHPAGHLPGSSQIRLQHGHEVWVISGDYKLESDGLTEPFEPVKCTHFVTESTFGLPVYNWDPQPEIFSDINNWWLQNKEQGKASVIFGYSLGKAQRIIANVNPAIGPILAHGAVENINQALRIAGINLPDTERITPETDKKKLAGSLIVAPPSALGSAWLQKMKPYSTGTASGWMALRGARRRRNTDRGFILSDHADWKQLNTAVKESGAENIFVTHGYKNIFSNWLCEQGYNASPIETEYEGELQEMGESADKSEEAEA